MTFSDISYFKIIDIFFTEAIVRTLWSILIFFLARFLIIYIKTDDSFAVPWPFSYPVKLVCFFIVLGYFIICLADIMLKTLHTYFAIYINVTNVNIYYIVSIIDSSLIIFAINYLVIKKYKWHYINFSKYNLEFNVRLGVLMSAVYFCIISIWAKAALTFYPKLYLANISYILNPAGIMSTVILVPISEELFFRGVLFQTLKARLPFVYAAALSSLFFIIFHMHIGRRIFAIFVLGYILAYLFFKSKSLIPGIILHASVNFFNLLSDHNNGIIIQLLPWNVLLVSSLVVIPLGFVSIKRLLSNMVEVNSSK